MSGEVTHPCAVCGETRDVTPIPLRLPRWFDFRYPPKESIWVCDDPAHLMIVMQQLIRDKRLPR